MTEKDLLNNMLKCLEHLDDNWYLENNPNISREDLSRCILYVTSKINHQLFDRNNKEQWKRVEDAMYERLKRKSPQSTFELTLGLPEGAGLVILDQAAYGNMRLDSNYHVNYVEK